MSYRPRTLAIHAGQPNDERTGAVTVPIYQTSTFEQSAPGVDKGYSYARTAHPTRDSLDYALLLLEAGGEERAARALKIIERVIALQEKDSDSKWYGIWGYYLEEPAPKMAPADWNWADFNGSLLLLIENRHGAKLPTALRKSVSESIRHAAYSVRRRNVAMTYTNIAVQGTFVTLAAAEVRGDKDLLAYARERLTRFARTVDETGSFNEYNSPTYTIVALEELARLKEHARTPEALPLIDEAYEEAQLLSYALKHRDRDAFPPCVSLNFEDERHRELHLRDAALVLQ